MNHKRMFVAIAVVLIAVLLLGELYVYTFSPSSTYGIESSSDGRKISYSVHSGIAETYDVAVFDNGGFGSPENYYIYSDGSYGSYFGTQSGYYAEQMKTMLKNTGVSAEIVDAQRLKNILSSGASRDALICVTGVLPDTVYSGKDTDLVFQWIHGGGRLYWAGNVIGSYYGTRGGTVNVPECQHLFLGCDCINNDIVMGDGKIQNGFCDALHLQNGQVLYGADTARISGTGYLALGYTGSGCASVTMFSSGEGMVCVFGGHPSRMQRIDVTQVVSSHIFYGSSVIEHRSGNLVRDTVSGSVKIEQSVENCTLYAYIGGDMPEYGRAFDYSFPNTRSNAPTANLLITAPASPIPTIRFE